MKATVIFFLLVFISLSLQAEDGHELWLRNKSTGHVTVTCSGNSATLAIAIKELQQGWQGKDNAKIVLTIKNDKAIKHDGLLHPYDVKTYPAVNFDGFIVKVNSEGMQGPHDYGRTHAQGANLLADALKPLWEECLKSETYQEGPGRTVGRCTDGSIFPQKHTGIAGVTNAGVDTNWCAFGRLAWDNMLTSEKIADEWIKFTFSQVLSGQAASTLYTTDWTPPYYHQADINGDSRSAGDQYHMILNARCTIWTT
jgi:hypothetical protein